MRGENEVADNIESRSKRTLKWMPFFDLPEDLLPRNFISHIFETLGTRISLLVLGVLTTAIVARSIGPTGRGLYALATTVSAIGVQLGNLGLHASNIYAVSREKSLATKLAINSLFVSFVFGGAGVLVAWEVFRVRPEWSPLQETMLALSLCSIPVGLGQMLLQNIFLGLGEVGLFNKVELITRVLAAVLVATFVGLGKGTPVSLFGATLIALGASLIWTLWRLWPFLEGLGPPSFSLLSDHLRYGLKAYLSAFFAFLVLRVDLLMVRFLGNVEQAGFYSIAVAMADMICLIPVVIGTLLFPRLSALEDLDEKKSLTKKIILLVIAVMAGLIAVAVPFASLVTNLLFGANFLPAVPAFLWLLPGVFFLSINVILMNYFASIGMPMVTVYSPLLGAALNIGLNVKLVPCLGIKGASLSSVAAYGLMLGCSLIYLRRKETRLESRLPE